MKRFWRLVEMVAFAASVLVVSAMACVVAAAELVLVSSWIRGGNGWYPLAAAIMIVLEVWILRTICRDELKNGHQGRMPAVGRRRRASHLASHSAGTEDARHARPSQSCAGSDLLPDLGTVCDGHRTTEPER